MSDMGVPADGEPRRAPYRNPAARRWRTDPPPAVIDFHRGMPGYAPTRLVELPSVAADLGVGRVFVKEESARFGLPAFKVLGASYAIARALSARFGSGRVLGLDELRRRIGAGGAGGVGAGGAGRVGGDSAGGVGAARTVPGAVRPAELIAATDGNHGRAVAHVARLLGLPARIFTPAGITAAAKSGIESEGARRVELDSPYDDVVLAAADAAGAADGAILVQDTSWQGYTDIPQWIVDGYTTLLQEADDQLAAAGIMRPDLVAVPVGVGSLAQSVVRHYRSGDQAGHAAPSVLSVEPTAAPALLESLRAGSPLTVTTGSTIMAGLNCGTPTAIGWPELFAGVDAAVTVIDAETARAVRDLEALGVDAGPCGAATLAGVRALAATDPLPTDATVLLLSTESRAANPLPNPLPEDA